MRSRLVRGMEPPRLLYFAAVRQPRRRVLLQAQKDVSAGRMKLSWTPPGRLPTAGSAGAGDRSHDGGDPSERWRGSSRAPVGDSHVLAELSPLAEG
jgi:hypothetical protein